jgi:hypothetical protein
VMRGRLDARRTLKSLVADLRFIAIMAIEAIVIAAIALSLLIGTFCK